MRISVDANICVAALRGRPPAIRQRLESTSSGELAISSIVLHELLTGAAKMRELEESIRAVHQFAGRMVLLDFNAEDASMSARLRAQLELQGRTIGPLDILIAGQALARGMAVATNNVREFARIPGLTVEDWLSPS